MTEIDAGGSDGKQAEEKPFFESFQAEDIKGWVRAKNIPNAEVMAKSYWNLEKFVGADKVGRGVVLPKPDSSPEEVSAFWGKVGRPDAPAGYEIPEVDGVDQKSLGEVFHKNNLTKEQAKGIMAWYSDHVAHIHDEFSAQSRADLEELKQEWGRAYDSKAELARRATDAAGMTDDDVYAVERVLGVKRAAKIFAEFGKRFAESEIKGEDGKKPSNTPMTAEEAMAQKRALMSDKDFTDKLRARNAVALEQMREIQRNIASQ